MICDQFVDGAALDAVQKQHPEIKILMASTSDSAPRGVNVIRKPVRPADMRKRLIELLDLPNTPQAVIKENWEAIGARVELLQVDSSVYFDGSPGNDQNSSHKYWDVDLAANGPTSPIPTSYLNAWYAGPNGENIAQRENDFVLAARAVGVPRRSILGSHILPNAISPVIVAGTLALATAIIDAAGLGFLGLGPQDPSTPEWGTMLTNTVRFLQTAPHLAIIPGLAIVITAISINLIGDGLREALDPKLRSR